MSAELDSFLRGTIAIDVLLLIALCLTLTRGPGPTDSARRWKLIGLGGVAVATQVVHFLEEWATGFYERFPELLGLESWSAGLWVGFNAAWMAIWCIALVGLRRPRRTAMFPIWFLALACAINGVAHPILALAAGGYFPGLWTSPLSGLVALLMLPRMVRFTSPE